MLELKYKWFKRFKEKKELTLRNLTNNEKQHSVKKIESYKTKKEQLGYLKALQSRHESKMKIYEKKHQTFV